MNNYEDSLKKAFGWEDICDCYKNSCFKHTHKFKFHRINKCPGCESEDIDNTKQEFGVSLGENSTYLNTSAKCNGCGSDLSKNTKATVEEYSNNQ